ncbi:MAG TPA: lysylphosphatidylglycerol synthase transmembrane domain-containing protein [Terriglobales bacterium]|nr:lysylphosphatidylglycerol synthase transmembrane domain-containing protein [Terriglobales bacterium]
MDKKRIVITAAALLILAALVYLQFRHWKSFDWATFWQETHQVNLAHIVHGVLLIYLGYVMRAVRWKLFLRPVRPKASSLQLLSPTLVGFTGLALLGRPGEFIRPYLIARRESLPVSSQIAVWTVERIFDVGAFAVLMVLAIFLPSAMPSIPHPEYFSRFRVAGFALIGIVVCLALGATLIAKQGKRVADWFEARFAHWSSNLAHRTAQKIREFGDGMNTIHGPVSLLLLVIVSLGMWYVIALAYQEVTHSYGVDALEIPVSQILLIMGSSMVGSMVQLPGVGGGSQLATIAALNHIFDVSPELAASCGIMLWLVTFFAVVPLGLTLAHREHLSLRKLSEESQHAEDAALALRPRP